MADEKNELVLESKLGKLQLDEFECVLCYQLFVEPITLGCGHTFCRRCLIESSENDNHCALCREVYYIDPAHHPVSITLQNILSNRFPEEYETRRKELIAEEAQLKLVLPLFPLDAVAFPGCDFPMHIFEPRYRLMLKRVMQGHKMIGLIAIKPDKNSPGGYAPCSIGCCIKIQECHTHPDGRSIINAKGVKRFKVVEHWIKDQYMEGRIEWLEDKLPESEEECSETSGLIVKAAEMIQSADSQHSVLGSLFSAIFGSKLKKLKQQMPDVGKTAKEWNDFSYWLSHNIPASLNEKQEWLEEPATCTRLKSIVQSLEAVFPSA